MDTGTGNFARLSPQAAESMMNVEYEKLEGIPSVFSKGEEVEIKNSRFKILSIGQKEMRLKLLPHKTNLPI